MRLCPSRRWSRQLRQGMGRVRRRIRANRFGIVGHNKFGAAFRHRRFLRLFDRVPCGLLSGSGRALALVRFSTKPGTMLLVRCH